MSPGVWHEGGDGDARILQPVRGFELFEEYGHLVSVRRASRVERELGLACVGHGGMDSAYATDNTGIWFCERRGMKRAQTERGSGELEHVHGLIKSRGSRLCYLSWPTFGDY